MDHLGIEEKVLIEKGAMETAREIEGQPTLWMKTWEKVKSEAEEISVYLSVLMPQVQRIILTGAGTSAYIGLSLKGMYQRTFNKVTEVIPTTDLVSHPENYFIRDIPTLLISFARSGNSPESVAAVSLADRHIESCFHLFITCDPNGKLAHYECIKNPYVFLMPHESNDKSLAMTGSYSAMLLAGLLIAEVGRIDINRETVSRLSAIGSNFIMTKAEMIRKIAGTDFSRVVFLGSGPLYGVATESHLKLQELTDGQVICKHDTFLGFRHGPKAVVSSNTLIFYLLSNCSHVRKYETDLIHSMFKGQQAMMEIGVCQVSFEELPLDHYFCFADKDTGLNDDYFCVAAILPAQMLGFYKSCQLDLSPDAPSASGAISRVVEGVKIYYK